MNIPTIELLAQICLNSEPDSHPPKAPKHKVKRGLRKMFEPFLGGKVTYAIEHLIVAAKTVGLVKEEGDYLVAIIGNKERNTCPTE